MWPRTTDMTIGTRMETTSTTLLQETQCPRNKSEPEPTRLPARKRGPATQTGPSRRRSEQQPYRGRTSTPARNVRRSISRGKSWSPSQLLSNPETQARNPPTNRLAARYSEVPTVFTRLSAVSTSSSRSLETPDPPGVNSKTVNLPQRKAEMEIKLYTDFEHLVQKYDDNLQDSITRFQERADRPELPESNQIQNFKLKLSPHYGRVLNHSTVCHSHKDVIRKGDGPDADFAYKDVSTDTSGQQSRPARGRDPSTSSSGFAAATTPVTDAIPKLTDELRQKLLAEGRCFLYRDKGHIIIYCVKNNRARIASVNHVAFLPPSVERPNEVGGPSITQTVRLQLGMGHNHEQIICYVADLRRERDLNLGVFWMERYDASPDLEKRKISFNSDSVAIIA
ncbi:hypothetical protein KCV07_g9901, partial [Aureobasidium melanogenum]